VLDLVSDNCIVVYIDDLLIYSKPKAERLQHLRSVLALLRKNGLCAKLSKCSFMQAETEFLGHTITMEGIKTLAEFTKTVRDWHTPKSTKDVQQFLGCAISTNIIQIGDVALDVSIVRRVLCDGYSVPSGCRYDA